MLSYVFPFHYLSDEKAYSAPDSRVISNSYHPLLSGPAAVAIESGSGVRYLFLMLKYEGEPKLVTD